MHQHNKLQKGKNMLYEKCLNLVEQGQKFKVDLKNKTVKVGDYYAVDNGVFEEDLGVPVVSCDEALSMIEDAYGNYYLSIPTERSTSQRRKYFIAKKESEMTDEEMCLGENRDIAQFKLEMLVLCLILNGSLKWEMTGNWFWKSNKWNELVILRDWI